MPDFVKDFGNIERMQGLQVIYYDVYYQLNHITIGMETTFASL